MPTLPRVLRVALDMPLRRLFDYLPPLETPISPLEPGMRVRVPFGRQSLVGVIMATAASSDLPAERLKPILSVIDTRPVLDPPALALLEWAADYYLHPIGEALAAALPKALRLGASATEFQQRWSATAAGKEAYARDEPRRAPRQRDLLAFLMDHEGATPAALAGATPQWQGPARLLAARGWIASAEAPVRVSNAPSKVTGVGPDLAPEQRAAVDAIGASLGHFAAFVLHGVTGSGKTEVYLRLVERVLDLGQRALVLIPEIGLTPQLVGRFAARFDAPLCVMHSALTDAER